MRTRGRLALCSSFAASFCALLLAACDHDDAQEAPLGVDVYIAETMGESPPDPTPAFTHSETAADAGTGGATEPSDADTVGALGNTHDLALGHSRDLAHDPMQRSADDVSEGSYDELGCLTARGASAVCSGGHGAPCSLAVACGRAQQIVDCRLRCRASSIARCTSPNEVGCVREATLLRSCTALSACPWMP